MCEQNTKEEAPRVVKSQGLLSWGCAVDNASDRSHLGEVGNRHVAPQRAELGLDAEHDPAIIEHLANLVVIGTARFSDSVMSDVRDQIWVDVLVQQYRWLNSSSAEFGNLQSLGDHFLGRRGHGSFLG